MLLVVRELAHIPCGVGPSHAYDHFLPPFKCGSCGEECDPVEITCVCSSHLCSEECAEEHVQYDRETCDG